jgi:flagellar biosynthesis protein FlhB
MRSGSDDPHSKTEQATPYKLEQARKKGMVARSMEVGVAAAAAATLVYLWGYGAELAADLAARMRYAIGSAGAMGTDGATVLGWSALFTKDLLSLAGPWLLVAAAAGFFAAFLQTGPVFAPAALKPDFSRLNPAAGLKRLFSPQTLMEAAKSSFKLAVFTAITVYVINAAVLGLAGGALDARGTALALVQVGAAWLLAFVLSAALFAALDLQLVRRRFAKRMRMSRRDLRDEARNREGEPRIKQRRRQIARELLERARSLRNVRGADMLITNPTHYAVALRYDPQAMAAPVLVAKGAGDFALRMRRVAFVYGVPCFEQPPLARELYRRLRIEQPVPERLYGPVAEIYLRARRSRRPARAAA